MKSPSYFIGYTTLEAWAKVAGQSSEPVYASLSGHKRGVANMPITTRVYATVQQISPYDGNVHYWSMCLGVYQTFYGESFGPVTGRDQARAGWDLLTRWLKGAGFNLVEGQVATPKNLTTFEGLTDIMHYDKDSGWQIVPEEAHRDNP